MVNILELRRRTERYEFADGVRDFHMAIWILVPGIYAWLLWDLPDLWLPPMLDLIRAEGRLFAGLVAFVFALGVPMIAAQGALRLMNIYLRRRWLWRATGTVTPRPWIVPRRVLFMAYALTLLVFVGGTLLAIQLGDGWLIIRFMYLGTGLAFAFMYWALGTRLGLPRYRRLALLGAAGTAAAVLLPLPFGLMGLLLALVWVGLLVASGLIALRRMAATQRELTDAS